MEIKTHFLKDEQCRKPVDNEDKFDGFCDGVIVICLFVLTVTA